MSRTVYVKITLEDDRWFDSKAPEWFREWLTGNLGQKYDLDMNVATWGTLPDMIADEIDLDALLKEAIDWVSNDYEAWLQNPTENPPTVAGALINLLKGDRP